MAGISVFLIMSFLLLLWGLFRVPIEIVDRRDSGFTDPPMDHYGDDLFGHTIWAMPRRYFEL
jgi:hypothetical protein